MASDREWARLMAHPVPKTSRRKTRWPINTKPPRKDCCGKQPPACECPKEAS